MNNFKREKAITLVALIITIIILLILAGITIGQLTDSGIFDSAKTAKEKYENAEKLENELLSQYENVLDGKYISDNSREDSTNPSGKIQITKAEDNIDVSNYQYADTSKLYTEEQYQQYGNSKYMEGISANANSVANAEGYECGILTIEQTGKIFITCGFKPKYVLIMMEKADSTASNNVLLYYNEKVSSTKSFRYNRVDNIMYEYTMEKDNEVSESNNKWHIYDITNSGFGMYASDTGPTISWCAFK